MESVPNVALSQPESLVSRCKPFQCFVDCEREGHQIVSMNHIVFKRKGRRGECSGGVGGRGAEVKNRPKL